jgi:hypothetical protein
MRAGLTAVELQIARTRSRLRETARRRTASLTVGEGRLAYRCTLPFAG